MKKTALGTLAMAIAAMACTDPTATTRALLPESVPLDVSEVLYTFPTPGFPDSVGEGGIRLCKRVSADDPGGSFNFTITTTGTGNFPDDTPTIVVPAGGVNCRIVYRSIVFNVNVEQVVITEDAPPAGWGLVAINTTQLLDEEIFNLGNYPAPRLGDTEVLGTRTATLYINNDMGRIVEFTNDFTGTTPPPPPPPPVCDFITFGRLVVQVGGQKVVISGNAGGFNANGTIKGEFHIEANGTDNHVAIVDSYGPITSGPLFGLTNSRIVTGVAKNLVVVELRLWDGGEPGKGTDRVYVKLNGVELFPNGASPFIDQGNMQYHANCRGPGDN